MLDLELETTPSESSYSAGLVDLMHQEEAKGAAGDFEQREALAEHVDRALAQETMKHFAGQADRACKRLNALFQQQVGPTTTPPAAHPGLSRTSLACFCGPNSFHRLPPPLLHFCLLAFSAWSGTSLWPR